MSKVRKNHVRALRSERQQAGGEGTGTGTVRNGAVRLAGSDAEVSNRGRSDKNINDS